MLNVIKDINTPVAKRRPDWLRVRIPAGDGYSEVKSIVNNNHLHTVCEEAHCPNIGECWGQRTATFMILGDVCTRSCGFCAIKTGRPPFLDLDEPRRVAAAVQKMRLRHAVITSVNRDELEDGGAGIFAETIRQIREQAPGCRVEVLVPDFKGEFHAVDTVVSAHPDIYNHNTETVPRLYTTVRPQGRYQWTLDVLRYAKDREMMTKSGMMLGIGENTAEVLDVMFDLQKCKLDILTLGQYLQPTPKHLPVDRFVAPAEFEMLKDEGKKMGFRHVESGPLVRSSYHAAEQVCE
jgi:lipoic acid synthetase